MLEITRKLERIGAGSDPKILIAVAIAAVLVGLFLWLGGLGLRRVLVVVIGAIGGSICGFFFVRGNPIHIAIIALIGSVLASIFEKESITILAVALAAMAAFVVLCDIYKINLADGLKEAGSALPTHAWIIIAVPAVAMIIGGFYAWRLISALCCSFTGTLLVFSGMVLLLFKKGSAPIEGISERPAFYAVVFGGMIAFGTLVQILFYKPPPKTKIAAAKKAAPKEEAKEPEGKPVNWRTQ
jgi:hypothetical protein